MKNEADIQDLAKGLIDWYWNWGCKRSGSYALPASGWLNQLYTAGKNASAVVEALGQERPSMAIWGPSQTGKSTLISAYMDGPTGIPENEADAGLGTGLHWQGGKGFYFMAPMVDNPDKLPWFMTRLVLNPFNRGMDGSSCLSRFTPGSLDGKAGTVKVRFPAYPVEMKMVTPMDLMHAIARGYSTECSGPSQGDPTHLSLRVFNERLENFLRKALATKAPPSREAYEMLHDFCEVVVDLSESDDKNFKSLGANKNELLSSLKALYDKPALTQSVSNVVAFAATVLWDGYEPLTEFFQKMVDAYNHAYGKNGAWKGKKVYCSLEATALFLNMGACSICYAPMPDSPRAPEAILKTLIAKLGWREQDGCIVIACEEGLPNRLSETAEQFSIYQGLVWELVIPVNLDNLLEHPFPAAPERTNAFKDFLRDADMLDFPGVGNDLKSGENRIEIDPVRIREIKQRASQPGASQQDTNRAKWCFTPERFFMDIVKRGKTASIVSTYAKRLNIDGFSIFQGLKGFPCANADQLVNGIRAWWKHSVPAYSVNPVGPSPMPLNVALTFWAVQLNLTTNPNDSSIYGKAIAGIVNSLGIVSDPGTSTTFAINNHKNPQKELSVINVDFSPGSVRYNGITRENAFVKQFAGTVSRASFDQMITDMETGGAEYFFVRIREQLAKVRDNPETNRLERLKDKLRTLRGEIESFLGQYDIFPNPKPKDTRREQLEAYCEVLEGIVERTLSDPDPAKALQRMHAINMALRFMLNVDYEELASIPMSRRHVTQDLIKSQLQQWVSAQAARCAADGGAARTGDPDWRSIGIDNPEKMREVLHAIAKSLDPDFDATVRWLAALVSFVEEQTPNDPPDLRRPLAVKMCNLICYGSSGAHTNDNPGGEVFAGEEPKDEEAPFFYFVKPILKRLRKLAQREVIPVKRPDQPGDKQLVELCQSFDLNPLKAANR